MFAYTVDPLYVKSGQDVIAADFYHPKNIEKPPVIIMAHGLAALRQFKLVQFAKRFARAGYAVVLFDYRYWGGEHWASERIGFFKNSIRRLANDDFTFK